MPRTYRLLPFVVLWLLFSTTVLQAQTKAQACFFSADLENGEIPAGWDIGSPVERQDPAGNGLGEFVPAWSVGTAADANSGGFFPVADIPTGNLFLMANDDAPPCNCAMADVAITTTSIDLSSRSGVALQCRVFHEQAMGGGPAWIEASANGGPWITMATIPVQVGEWQDLFVNLGAFDGLPDLRLRFRWSDNGGWASGLAIDDICISERYAVDFSVLRVYPNDRTASPFMPGDQSLYYRQKPLEQAGPLTITAEVMNSGTMALSNVEVFGSLFFNGNDFGPFTTEEVIDLAPGERRLVVIPTGWVPDAPGELDIFIQGGTGQDEDVNDNSGLFVQHITGPGWDNGYGAMACDDGAVQGSVGGQEPFIAGNRMELVNEGSVPRGISAVLGAATQEGAQVRGILFDANLAFVDTTLRTTLTVDDIFQAGLGLPIHLAFGTAVTLPAGDYYVGLQHLEGEVEGAVHVATSGNGPVGAAVLMQGINFDVTYLRSTPMVRLHLDEFGVGLDDAGPTAVTILSAHPVPMRETGTLVLTLDHPQELRVVLTDATGRLLREDMRGMQGAGQVKLPLDVTGFPPGIYLASVHGNGFRATTRMVVE